MDHEVWKKFEANNITHSAAHHLLAVHELRKERGYARVTDVAKHLSITTGSASTNLKSLKQKGLITEDDNRFLVLSSEGESLAKAVVARKEIFYRFLIDVLGVTEPQAEIDACKTEHLLSHETCEKLLGLLQNHFKEKTSKKTSKSSLPVWNCPISDGSHDVKQCPVCTDRCLMDEC